MNIKHRWRKEQYVKQYRASIEILALDGSNLKVKANWSEAEPS